jgi:hypothetical protein
MPDQRDRSIRLLVLAVVLALGTLTLGAGPALAQPLQCGDTVTEDTTLPPTCWTVRARAW